MILALYASALACGGEDGGQLLVHQDFGSDHANLNTDRFTVSICSGLGSRGWWALQIYNSSRPHPGHAQKIKAGLGQGQVGQASSVEVWKPQEGSWEAIFVSWYKQPVRHHLHVQSRLGLGFLYLACTAMMIHATCKHSCPGTGQWIVPLQRQLLNCRNQG